LTTVLFILLWCMSSDLIRNTPPILPQRRKLRR
jgi:hypothetical protein